MSQGRPAAGCFEIPFAVPCPLDAPAQVALEDYARVLTGAAAAETMESAPAAVSGVHLCGLPAAPSTEAERDLIDFARELASATPGGGLGWS